MILNDEYYMRIALAEAKMAFEEDEIPVGAVVVCNGQIIARAHNMTEKLNDVTAHAEMLAFTSASNFLNSKYLDECTLYVTLEPCPMCAGAGYWTQLSRIVYGAFDEKKGFTTVSKKLIHPRTETVSGVLSEESALLLKEFFKNKRD
ncbi:MAG TPA: nucleoside deaminase [Bacteroidia bacterium]|nr:nucleoside deaminase [Bacteroidia bacterium]